MEAVQINLNVIWLIVAASMVFFMQVGFTAYEAGCVQVKNVISVSIKNLTDFLVSSMVFYLFGFGLMFGLSSSGWIGTSYFLLSGIDSVAGSIGYPFFFFQLVFAGTAATILTGAVAERSKLSLNLWAAAFIVGIIYPVFGHWVWGGMLNPDHKGWLESLGFIDFAGSTVVHSIGGWVALAGAIVLGPRRGKYNPDGTVNKMGFHNIPLSTLGVFFLWFGWFGFNGGSGLIADAGVGLIIVNTIMAPTASGLVALIYSYVKDKRPDVSKIFTAILGGLVAVTAGSNRLQPEGAIIIGLVAGIVAILAQEFIEKKLKISATDLDVSITASLDCKVTKRGSVAIPGRILFDIIKELPESEVTLEATSNRFEIKIPNGNYKIASLSPDDFPKLPAINTKKEIRISGEDLVTMIQKTSFACSTDETRPALNGVLWQTNGEKMQMVATDGHRLARMAVDNKKLKGMNEDIIIPPKVLNLIPKFLDGKKEDIGIIFGENNIIFNLGDTVLTSRLIEGPYPNFEQVIPKDNDKKMK